MKYIIAFVLLTVGVMVYGQNISTSLSKIKTIEQAKEFIITMPHDSCQLITLTSDIDSNELAKKILKLTTGKLLNANGYIYKCIETKMEGSFRVSYIYLNGNKLSKQKIDSLRTTIIEEYRKGKAFVELVKEFNMDSNPDGNFGWYPESMAVKDFSKSVKVHKRGDIFTIDIPENKWYYVTLKTYDNRPLKTSTVLKVKFTN